MTEVPAGWELTTLGQLGRYINGRGFKKSEWRESGRPIIRIQNLTGTSESFNYFDGWASEDNTVRTGDLLISWAATLGAYFWHGPEAVVNQHIFKVESRISKRFHKQLLDYKLEELKRHAHGSGMVHITRSKFDSIPVLLPRSISDQQRIIDMLEDHLSRLDAADGMAKTVELRLGALRRAALTSVIDREDRRRTALGHLVQRIEAGRSFGGSAAPATEDEWGIIKVSAMTWGAFRAQENKAVPAAVADARHEIRPGDLLVSRANTSAYVGASVFVEDVRPRLLLSDKSLRLVPVASVDSRWLQLALSSPRAREQISAKATGTKDSMRNISQGALLSIEVPDVTAAQQAQDVAEAKQHAGMAERLAGELGVLRIKQTALRRALLTAAFTGRLTGRSTDAEVVEELAAAEPAL